MIVPMKKATLAVMYDTAPAVIKALQRIGEFMIIPGKDGSLIRLKSNEKPLSEEARTALKAYEKFRRKKGLLSAPYECTYEEFNKENDTEKQNVITAIRLAEELDSQNAQIKRLQEEKAGLSVFSGLSLTAEELGGSGNTRILVGKLPLNEKKGLWQHCLTFIHLLLKYIEQKKSLFFSMQLASMKISVTSEPSF